MLLKTRTESVKELRQNGIVPGVMYGKNFTPVSVQVDEKELISAYNKFGQSLVFDVELDGVNHKVYIKELQHELLNNRKFIHFDIIKVTADTLITADIPVIVEGREAVEEKKLFVEIVMQTVKAEYPATMGVANFEFDVTDFDVDDAIHVKDIVVEEGINLLDDPEQMILVVKEPVMIEELLDDEEDSDEELLDESEETEQEDE